MVIQNPKRSLQLSFLLPLPQSVLFFPHSFALFHFFTCCTWQLGKKEDLLWSMTFIILVMNRNMVHYRCYHRSCNIIGVCNYLALEKIYCMLIIWNNFLTNFKKGWGGGVGGNHGQYRTTPLAMPLALFMGLRPVHCLLL